MTIRAPAAALASSIPRAALGLCVAAVLLVPFRVVALGFLPGDDALRHAAKAVSGREWSQILLLRPDATLDSHPGWHALLGAVHRRLGADGLDLVLLSTVGLFLACALPPLVLLGRPEAFLAALAGFGLADPGTAGRLLLGRPFLLTQSFVCVLCLCWPRLAAARAPRGLLALLAGLVAACVWVHGNWYMQLLPLACFFLAGEHLAGRRYAASLAAGTAIGAALTGRPVAFLYEALLHAYLSVAAAGSEVTQVSELHASGGSPLVVAGVLGLLALRRHDRPDGPPAFRDPAFVLAFVGWLLGFVSGRFYTDWAVPGLLAFAAAELGSAAELRSEAESPARLWAAGFAALVAFLVLTSGMEARSAGSPESDLAADNPRHRPWLPEPGGILYSADMAVFYRTFFRNPEAPWRYALGFEPAIMPEQDLAIFREIRRTHGATEAYLPWVRRMHPQDRLLVRMSSAGPPPIPGLEWYQPVPSIWSGRLPRAPVPPHS